MAGRIGVSTEPPPSGKFEQDLVHLEIIGSRVDEEKTVNGVRQIVRGKGSWCIAHDIHVIIDDRTEIIQDCLAFGVLPYQVLTARDRGRKPRPGQTPERPVFPEAFRGRRFEGTRDYHRHLEHPVSVDLSEAVQRLCDDLCEGVFLEKLNRVRNWAIRPVPRDWD